MLRDHLLMMLRMGRDICMHIGVMLLVEVNAMVSGWDDNSLC